jgi:hypothetical protein
MNRSKLKEDGPIMSRLIGLIAAMFFAVPTAALVWFGTNKQLAFWGTPDAFISTEAFWFILGGFALSALAFPNAFPSILGGIWQGLIKIHRWLG